MRRRQLRLLHPFGHLAWLLFLSACGATPIVCVSQTYVDFEPSQSDPDMRQSGPAAPTLLKSDGKKITAPSVADQIGFTSVRISRDHRRVGWIVLKKNACCSAPLGLVVFKGDKIERVIEDSCIWRWIFRGRGLQIAYQASTCHFSSGPTFVLLDVDSGIQLGRYGFESDDGDDDELPPDSPSWAREVVDSSD